MAIDCHAHWIPPAVAMCLRQRRAAPRIEDTSDGEMFVTYQGRRPFQPLGDIEARLGAINRHGVAMQVLSLAGLFGIDSLPLDESIPLVTAFNDAVADLQRSYPRNFRAIAALPLADIALACRELVRVHALGLRGAILPADGFASLLAAERFRQLFVTGNRLHSHFFVHPGPLEPQPERQVRGVLTDCMWQRRIVLAAQSRLSEVMVTLDLSDFLDPYPDVTVQVANLGGTIPFLIERMDQVHRDTLGGEPAPSQRMRACYVDTASFGPRAIEMAVACFGADRVILGTDDPIFSMQDMLKAVADTRLDTVARNLILSGNASRLLLAQTA